LNLSQEGADKLFSEKPANYLELSVIPLLREYKVPDNWTAVYSGPSALLLFLGYNYKISHFYCTFGYESGFPHNLE
jgi:hypothetical protein